jgi:hypothetical protein
MNEADTHSLLEKSVPQKTVHQSLYEHLDDGDRSVDLPNSDSLAFCSLMGDYEIGYNAVMPAAR